MKTAISIPDPLFQAAEGLAQRLRMSRSELYANAVAEYIDSHKHQNVTEALDEVYSQESSSLDQELNAMQMHSLPKQDW